MNFEIVVVEGPKWNHYDDPDYWSIYIIKDNQLLEEKKVRSQRELGHQEILLEQKYNNMSKAGFQNIKAKRIDLCDHCGHHMLNGSISCVNKHFCIQCEKYLPEYQIAYHQDLINASIVDFQPQLDILETTLKRRNFSQITPELVPLKYGVAVKISDFKLPKGWNKTKTDLWLRLSNFYKGNVWPDDYFMMDKDLTTQNGDKPYGFIFDGNKDLTTYKLGLQKWGPKDNLVTLFNTVRLGLESIGNRVK